MPRSKTPQSPEATLANAIHTLAEEVRVLRDAIDELREQVAWANHNHDESHFWAGSRIQDCSLDSAGPHFAVSTVDEATVEQLRTELTPDRSVSGKQRPLFD